MSRIDITRKHSLPLSDARKKIERVAKSIEKRFDIEYGWEGDTLRFERSGVNGQIVLTKTTVRVFAHLSFLLLPLKGAVESEIEKQLEKEFD
jgi:putative polyhydroxyalkanoate system protein